MNGNMVPAPQTLAHHFLTMAYNSAWSNHRLLAACAQLSQADFTARRTSFFPSLKATLNHILTVDWYYVEIFERSFAGLPPHESPWRHFEPEEPFETCAVKPPQLDEFFCTNEAELRADDFARLGFSEAMIWGERARPPGA